MDLLIFVGPMTRLELQQMLKLSDQDVISAIRRLKEAKRIRICKYERPDGNGNFAPVYAEGAGADAKRPKPLTKEEVTRRYNQRHSAVISARRYAEYHKAMGPWAGLMR